MMNTKSVALVLLTLASLTLVAAPLSSALASSSTVGAGIVCGEKGSTLRNAAKKLNAELARYSDTKFGQFGRKGIRVTLPETDGQANDGMILRPVTISTPIVERDQQGLYQMCVAISSNKSE